MTRQQENWAMETDRESLEALAADERLRELGRYVRPLSLPRAFGVARDEMAHSRVLAEILDPARHAGAGAILRFLLREASRTLKQEADEGTGVVAKTLETVADGPFDRVAVRRESMLMDVVVEVSGPDGETVIGIENKIDAGEQPDQIARYQATLSRAYPGRAAAMVFLTPTGRTPTTSDPASPVPAVALGYGWLARALSEVRRAAPTGRTGADPDGERRHGERDRRVLAELEEHVREEILGQGKTGLEDIVRELWREHGRALRLAMDHRPRLADIRQEYVSTLEAIYGDDTHFDFWGRGRDLREIKMNLRSWDRTGFPFTFMLRVWEGERPQVRALVWKDRFRKRAESLPRWARGANASLGSDVEPLIDEAFTPVRRWTYWHRIFREEDYPAAAEIADDAFDGETVREAVGAVVALVELLRPHIEPYVGASPKPHVEGAPADG